MRRPDEKILFLTIPFLVLIMVGVITAHLEGQRTPDRETELNQYVIDYSSPTSYLQVRQVVEAKRPLMNSNSFRDKPEPALAAVQL